MEEEKKPEEQPVEPEQPEQPPTPQPGPPPPTPRPGDTNTLIILGWVFVGLSLFTCCCCSYIFAPAAAILGGIAYSRGDQRGLPILIIGIVLFLLGGGFWIFTPRYTHYPGPWQHFPNIPGPWRRV
jgi:hypothetical protein